MERLRRKEIGVLTKVTVWRNRGNGRITISWVTLASSEELTDVEKLTIKNSACSVEWKNLVGGFTIKHLQSWMKSRKFPGVVKNGLLISKHGAKYQRIPCNLRTFIFQKSRKPFKETK